MDSIEQNTMVTARHISRVMPSSSMADFRLLMAEPRCRSAMSSKLGSRRVRWVDDQAANAFISDGDSNAMGSRTKLQITLDNS